MLPDLCRDNPFYKQLLKLLDASHESSARMLKDFKLSLETIDVSFEHPDEIPLENSGEEMKKKQPQDELSEHGITKENEGDSENFKENGNEENNSNSESDGDEDEMKELEELLVIKIMTSENGSEIAQYLGCFPGTKAKGPWFEVAPVRDETGANIIGITNDGIILSGLKSEGSEACFLNQPFNNEPKKSTPAHVCWIPNDSSTKECSHHFFAAPSDEILCIIPQRCCEAVGHDSIDRYDVMLYDNDDGTWNLLYELPISQNLRSQFHDNEHFGPCLMELKFDVKINHPDITLLAYGCEGFGAQYDVIILSPDNIELKASGIIPAQFDANLCQLELVAACTNKDIRIMNPTDGSHYVHRDGLRYAFPPTIEVIRFSNNEKSTEEVDDRSRYKSRIRPPTFEEIPIPLIAGGNYDGHFVAVFTEGPYLSNTLICQDLITTEHTYTSGENLVNEEISTENKKWITRNDTAPPVDQGIKQVATLVISKGMLNQLSKRPKVHFHGQKEYKKHGPYHHSMGYEYTPMSTLKKNKEV